MSWTIERRGRVAVVTMTTNAVNAQNGAFFADLHEAFDRLEREHAHSPVVLTGTGVRFSAGLDLGEHFPLFAGDRTAVASGGITVRGVVAASGQPHWPPPDVRPQAMVTRARRRVQRATLRVRLRPGCYAVRPSRAGPPPTRSGAGGANRDARRVGGRYRTVPRPRTQTSASTSPLERRGVGHSDPHRSCRA
jgi:hypothetical protein